MLLAKLHPAVRGCLDACDRCERILDALPAQLYATAAPGRAPIGAHLRHAVEHFTCLLRGLDEGLADYDARERDEQMERDPERFRAALAEVRRLLASIRPETLKKHITVCQTAAIDAAPSRMHSTVERELVFVSSHTIHHLAVVVSLCREQGIDLSDDLAIAFSTAAHRQAMAR
jgi:uncharacterized damage-inducible protein DinB